MKFLPVLLALPFSLTLAWAQSDTTTFRSEEVSYWNPVDSVRIGGTLTIPDARNPQKFPVALLITGSGAQDRDETILGKKPFKRIAEYLSARGFAMLRLDDRGIGKTSLGRNGSQATSLNFARDVGAGIEFLKARPEIDPKRIGLIGHSEGGLIAPMVAAKAPDDVAFLISLAGTGVPGGTIMKKQNRDIFRANGLGPVVVERYGSLFYDAFIDQLLASADTAQLRSTLEKGAVALRSQSSPDELKKLGFTSAYSRFAIGQFVKISLSPWFRYFVIHDPAADWQRVKCPVLALNGAKDVQVDAVLNLAAIEKALKEGGNTQYKVVNLPELNHLFQKAKTGSMAEYAAPNEQFSMDVLRLMNTWLREVTR